MWLVEFQTKFHVLHGNSPWASLFFQLILPGLRRNAWNIWGLSGTVAHCPEIGKLWSISSCTTDLLWFWPGNICRGSALTKLCWNIPNNSVWGRGGKMRACTMTLIAARSFLMMKLTMELWKGYQRTAGLSSFVWALERADSSPRGSGCTTLSAFYVSRGWLWEGLSLQLETHLNNQFIRLQRWPFAACWSSVRVFLNNAVCN